MKGIRWFSAFLIQPYLFTLGGQGIGLGWQYDSITEPRPLVQLYKDRKLLQTVAATSDKGLHSVKLPLAHCGFGPGYAYRVSGQSDLTPITPIPCPGERDSTRFTFIADSQEGPEFVHQFAEEMARFPGAAFVVGGDFVDTGNDFANWLDYFDAMSPVGGSRMLVMAVGNHEYRFDDTVPLWKRFFGRTARETHYTIDIGHAKIIVLNSCFEDDPTLFKSQLPWLRQELAKPAHWKVVVFHHPAYSVGVFNSPLAPKKEWEMLQREYIPLFETFGVDLVLNGHTHIYERSRRNGINYLTAGPAGGKMGAPGTTNPWSLLVGFNVRTMTHFELDSRTLRGVTYDQYGNQLDQMMLTK